MTVHPPIQADDPAEALGRRLAVLDAITSALAEAIIARAQEDQVDLIAMTTHGRSGLSQLLDRVLTTVMEITGVDGGGIFLLDQRTGDLRLTTHHGLSPELVDSFSADPGPSIRALAADPKAAVIVRDVRTQRITHRALVEEHVRAYAGIPLHVQEQLLGVLVVISRTASDLNQADVNLLVSIGKQIGLAIERARLYDAAQRALRRTRAFQEVVTAMTASLDLRTTLKRALDVAMDVFGADRASLWLVDQTTHETHCAASRNLSPAYLEAVTASFTDAQWPAAVDTERSVYVEDAQTAHPAPELRAAVRREGFHTMLFLLLSEGEKRVGNFVLYHDRIRHYTEEEIGLARTFADQANIAIQHASLFEGERRAREQAATILAATRTVTSSLNVDDVLAQAAGCIAAALRQRACGVWLLNGDGTMLAPVYRTATRPNPELDRTFRALPPIPVDAAPRIKRLLADAQASVVQRPEDLSEPEQLVRRVLPFDAYVAIPLAARNRVLGIATVPVLERHHHVDEADIEVAMAIARSTALALENARLYEESQRLAAFEERNRLARELHDSVSHSLFSMNLIAQALPRIMERDPARAKERIERLSELGRGALAEMRALIFHLRPAALEEQGLAAALAKHTAAFESREAVKVELTVTGERRLALIIEETIFRVAQEALNNIAKHAAARRVAVTLTVTETHAELVVRDDGRGFDLAALPAERTSLGLTSMGERARLAGGVCTVDSAPGKGTTVSLRVPVDPSQQ